MRNDPTAPSSRTDGVPCNELEYFTSYYRATLRGRTPTDRLTIGSVSDLESRFHYNAVENSILRAHARHGAVPRGALVEAWSALRRRQELRMVDVGTGTGHWVDFFREVLLVRHVVALEIVPEMAEFLREKYAGEVTVLEHDVAATPLAAEQIGGPVDYVTSIGVMFHIVDDARWEAACRALAGLLKPGGWWIVGGDFGHADRDVQFHQRDDFATWREANERSDGAPRVNKRVRSLARWVSLARELGLDVVDLIRTDSDPLISTPENDVLVLARPT